MLLSRANVAPQKLKSAARNRAPSRQVVNCSRSPSTSPVAMSMSVVLVENDEFEYAWPVTKTVNAPTRPSGETRVRLGLPSSLIEARDVSEASKTTAVYVVKSPRLACKQIPRPAANDTRSHARSEAARAAPGEASAAAASLL